MATTTTKNTTTKNTTTKNTTTTTKRVVDQPFSIAVGTVEISTDDVRDLVTDSAYATVGAGDYAVSVVRDLPGRLDHLRRDQITFVKDAPTKAQRFVKDVPTRLQTEVNAHLTSVRGEVETYATRGRKLVNTISESAATKRALSQTETARSQVKGAVTSIRKAADQSQEAARKAVSRFGNRR